MNENIAPEDTSGNKGGLVVVSILFDSVDAVSSVLFEKDGPPVDGIDTLSEAATKLTDEGE